MALARLPAELLRIIIAALVKARDARQLEKLGATCHVLWELCREEAPWRALLMAHFDVDVPEALPYLGPGHPREILLFEVGYAQQLTIEYAESEQNNLPVVTLGVAHALGPSAVRAWVRSIEYHSWMVSLANRIQMARGGPPISGSDPEKFRKTALYRELANHQLSAVVSYGRYMRLTCVNKYAKNELGCTDEEVTISKWLARNGETSDMEADPDYTVMQDWTRRKLNDIARPQYLAMVDDLRALLQKHGKWAAIAQVGGTSWTGRRDVQHAGTSSEPALRRMLAGFRRDAVFDDRELTLEEDYDGDNLRSHRRRFLPSLCERPIATTKLLAGLHGGLFVYSRSYDEAGSYWFSTMFCLADRDAVIHEVPEDDGL